MTYRRLRKRPVLPVLVAVLMGATTAGAATVLAKPLDGSASDEAAGAASFTSRDQPPVPLDHPGGRPAGSGAATRTVTALPAPTATTKTPAPLTSATSAQPPAPPAPPSPKPPPAGDAATQVVTLVNEARADSGCAPLAVDARLTAAATDHSADMAARDYFSHTTPEGVPFDQRITAAGYLMPGAENIAMGQETSQDVMDAWMKSKGHKANILNCQLTTIGVGFDPNGFYWTQDFGY